MATAFSSGARSTRSSSENDRCSSVAAVASASGWCSLDGSPETNGMNLLGTRSDARSELERDRLRLLLTGSIVSSTRGSQ